MNEQKNRFIVSSTKTVITLENISLMLLNGLKIRDINIQMYVPVVWLFKIVFY